MERRMNDPRALALRILTQAQHDRTPSEALLAPLLARSALDARDRRLVTTLVQMTHRWRGRADRVLDTRLLRGVRSLDPNTLNTLRLAYVQLFHLDQIPAHAIVHTAVDLAWRHGGEGKARLVNKILRGLISRPPGPGDWLGAADGRSLEGDLSHPDWLIARWVERWGEPATRRICEWNNQTPSFHLRVHGGPPSVARVSDELRSAGMAVAPGRVLPEALRLEGTFDAHAHPLVKEGRVSVQDEGQMLVAHLWPEPDATPVLDLCAAPGTKTGHLAERTPQGTIFASDHAPRRLQRVRDTVARLGLANVACFVADGRMPPVRPVMRRVLLDAPCTSLGVLQRRPDARWLHASGDIHTAAELQAQLLDAAAGLLLPGGCLVYSVCSLETEETEERIAAFLDRHRDFAPEALPAVIPESLRGAAGIVQVLPGTLGMEGLFAALLRKRA
jgi:16S rRNA (cytosine967-C5)-methyltransferase